MPSIYNADITRAYLDDFLAEHHGDSVSVRSMFDERLARAGFQVNWQGRSFIFPISLGPLFVNAAAYEELTHDIQHILTACLALRRAYLASPEETLKVLALPVNEQQLYQAEAFQEDLFGAIRVDVFPTEDGGAQLIELNSDNPDAIVGATEAYRASLDFLLNKARLNLQAVPQLASELLLSIQDQYGSIGTLAILKPENIPINEYEIEQEFFQKHGFQCLVGQIADVRFDGKQAHLKQAPFNLLRRVTEISYYADNLAKCEPLVQALRARCLQAYNSFQDRILGHKSLFALLSDPEYAHFFTDQQRDAIARRIPWTRIMTHSLRQTVLSRKASFVLKPAGLTAARGVWIGCESTAEEWLAAVECALRDAQPWIVQTVIKAAHNPVLHDDQGVLKIEEEFVDFSVMVFGHKHSMRFVPAFARFNHTLVNNINRGGKMSIVQLLSNA